MALNNCTEESEIDWNNVFVLNEFVNYFDIKSLAEFSLMSKYNRDILKSKLFSHLTLKGENHFSYFKNNLFEYEDKLYFSISSFIDNFLELERYYIDLKEQLTNISELLDLMNRLSNESRKIEPFVKSLRAFELGHLLYILYPATFVFTNLTQLEIDSCTFPLLAQLRIGESLKKLKKLTLKKVLLIRFEKQELLSLAYFPTSLEELNLDFIYIVTLNPKTSDFFIARNKHHKDCIESICFELIFSSLKRLTLFFIYPEYIRKLLNISPNVVEITINDCALDQIIIDKLSTMESLTKLSIHTFDPDSTVISSHSDYIFSKFNFITHLALEFRESMYKTSNEFLHFTNHFPNLTWLSIDLTSINFENIDVGKFFLETLPSYKNLEILTLVYMEFKEENNFNWLKFINVECLILNFDFFDPDEIDFNLFSYKIKEIRKRTQHIKFELECIEDNPEMFDKWNIKAKGEYIYFTK